jgi:hypothetical protein
MAGVRYSNPNKPTVKEREARCGEGVVGYVPRSSRINVKGKKNTLIFYYCTILVLLIIMVKQSCFTDFNKYTMTCPISKSLARTRPSITEYSILLIFLDEATKN